MLKELVRERLITAAEEIFGLFEKTIASYEEQLCRAREETERHRRQLEAVCNTQIVIRVQEVGQVIARQEELPTEPQEGSSSLEQEYPQPPHVKEEVEEADISKLPLTGVFVESEHAEPRKSSVGQHCSPSGDHHGGPPPDNLFASLSDRDDMKESLMSDTDCKGDKKQLEFSEKETTLNKKAFETHIRTLTRENSLSCSLCGKIKETMLKHMTTHVVEKPFSCSACGKSFSQKPNMLSHMKTHTTEKPFCCSVCGKSFTAKAVMVKHVRTHTGEKPFSCLICGKAFSQKPHLVSHTRTHTGEKPFGCSVCTKTFSTKSQVVSHKRIHTGEKPYNCSVCGGNYARKSSLTAHMWTHSKEGINVQ
ncbi:zinc finger protein OZF-like [Phyllopteryx taeniolatus]|uniref:zinc finger protein OZF-like n=1 Tax=Phyllopteryx taeniolatus TaxID=161469 RepID=UPI002AD59938|nr:zinc finger protein OZF-like [Phyllopteryx taeniolatus]